ncbi:ImmA/IrrE family metallo-endopeptidase [Microcoleus sp. LAD1_D5]|uniref:ImmA/IrrE family metallo-endopeptidase n=1 Tax=unclassified Microcoleus TaxID=2642155 RepID=UPI002FCFD736
MTQTLSMSVLYKKLSAIGFPKPFVREKGLPSWWNEELDNKPVAVLEAAGHIAQRLHLDLKSLLAEDQNPQFKPLLRTKFKYHQQDKADVPDVAHQLASRVAEVVADTIKLEFQPIPSDPHQVRSEIVAKHSQVTLESLLDYCWEHGIAVVYFKDYPKNTRKIRGMIQWQADHPVIVLSSGNTQPVCLAFDLAHELGHLALAHIQEGILIDDDIKQDCDDQEERDSNQFAVKLLVNSFDNSVGHKKFKNAEDLKNKIIQLLQSDSTIDPCALALNYGWYNKDFALSMGCVKLIHPAKEGHKTINKFLDQHLNWEELSDDNADYLDQILGE